MQATVTFVRHNPKQVNGQNGPFTVHEFFTQDGTKFDTSKTDVANAAYALAFANGAPTNAALLVTYEEKQNGQWTNRRITAVQGAGDGAMAPGVMPSGSQQAPTAAPSSAPATSSAPTTGGTGQNYRPTAPEDAARMSRSKGLELAIKAAEGGLISISGIDDFFGIAGSFAQYIFKGSRPSSPAATGADSSGAGGGGEAGAAPAAPAPTSAPAAADDDIPF